MAQKGNERQRRKPRGHEKGTLKNYVFSLISL